MFLQCVVYLETTSKQHSITAKLLWNNLVKSAV